MFSHFDQGRPRKKIRVSARLCIYFCFNGAEPSWIRNLEKTFIFIFCEAKTFSFQQRFLWIFCKAKIFCFPFCCSCPIAGPTHLLSCDFPLASPPCCSCPIRSPDLPCLIVSDVSAGLTSLLFPLYPQARPMRWPYLSAVLTLSGGSTRPIFLFSNFSAGLTSVLFPPCSLASHFCCFRPLHFPSSFLPSAFNENVRSYGF